jgi:hypothetical protein
MGSLSQTSGNQRLGVPTSLDDVPQWLRLIAVAINNLLQGKSLNTGNVTLTANSATTTLTDDRIGPNTVITFMPTTANAATATGNLYVSARTSGSATLTHANNAQTDRSFAYEITG